MGGMRATTAPETAALTLERFLELRRPVEVELSPDGGRVAFTVSPVAKEKGKGLETRLWLGDVDGETAAVGEAGATDGLPRFAPDGTQLAFASDSGHTGRMSLRPPWPRPPSSPSCRIERRRM